MTVGNPEFNLDSFGIKYVKKAKESHESGGDSGITARTTSLLSNQDIATSGFGDRQSDSVGDTSRIEGTTQGGKDETGKHTQAMTSSGKLGDKHGKKVGTEASQDSGIKDHYSGQKRDAAGNVNTYKKPEGQTLPKNASLNLAIIKCKLLKLKAHNFSPDDKASDFQESKADSSDLLRVDTPRRTSTGEVSSNQSGDKQQEVGRADTQDDRKTKASGGDSNYKSTPSTKEPISGIAPEVTETTKGTGDKIPAEKLGDLPVGKVDEKEVGGTEIEDQHGKTRKLTSPHEAYKAEVREMAIDAIDMAMKTIAMYQDKKEKSLQEELIKDAYEAQLKNDSANTSDGVNAVYSDVHQKKINKE